jgi:tRNA U34 5-methylaminomethyl-2-thiouridine-forming methyltransferase MnmC
MAHNIHQTKDGSSTLYSSQFEQFYHNPNGAVSESKFVFFETSGLLSSIDKMASLTVLEVGFGTGLNFLLLLDLLLDKNLQVPISFFSIEAFPIHPDTARHIDFSTHLNHPELNKLLPDIFGKLKPGMNALTDFENSKAELHLFYGDFDDFQPKELKVDYIFHDPFSPAVNEKLWTKYTFEKLAGFSTPSTVLATYCAASKARGAMCAADWRVARAPGALGKREMTLATRSEEKLSGFKRVNEQRLAKRYRAGDF